MTGPRYVVNSELARLLSEHGYDMADFLVTDHIDLFTPPPKPPLVTLPAVWPEQSRRREAQWKSERRGRRT